MAGEPLVSVVMIFLDGERFLQEALDSVFAQSWQHWELLLVDDGSTDGSGAIAKRCAEGDPARVRYLAHPGHENRGMSASRNLGIREARGEYIALLDADDVWLPRRLEEQVAILQAHPRAAMVFGNREYWSSWAGSADGQGDPPSAHGIAADTVVQPPGLLTLVYVRHEIANPASDITFRRKTALRLGGFEEAFTGLFEDQAFHVKVFLHEPVYVSNRCWLRYRQHPDSCVAKAIAAGTFEPALARFLAWFRSYLVEHGMKGTPVWWSVLKGLWRLRHPTLFKLGRSARTGARRVAGKLRVVRAWPASRKAPRFD